MALILVFLLQELTFLGSCVSFKSCTGEVYTYLAPDDSLKLLFIYPCKQGLINELYDLTMYVHNQVIKQGI